VNQRSLIISQSDCAKGIKETAAGVTSRRSFVSMAPVLSSALLAALLTAALFFLFAPLTFTFFSVPILLPALSGRTGFVRLVWISLCVHDAFLYY